jgi:hypothetical protein
VLDAFAAYVVFGATDDAALEFEHDACAGTVVQQLRRDAQVLLERQRGAVEHVGVEQRWLAVLPSPHRLGQQRPDECVELVRRAVVGMEGHENAVLAPHLVGEGRERSRPALAVADGGAGQVRGATRRQLDDPVGFGVGEAPQRGVQSLGRAHVDRWVRVAGLRGGVEHLGVLLRVGNAHAESVLQRGS